MNFINYLEGKEELDERCLGSMWILKVDTPTTYEKNSIEVSRFIVKCAEDLQDRVFDTVEYWRYANFIEAIENDWDFFFHIRLVLKSTRSHKWIMLLLNRSYYNKLFFNRLLNINK